MNRFFERGWEAFLAIFVIAVAALLLVPLPTQILDLLLVLNIGFSLLLLFLGLYVSSTQSLLSFPSLLLLATLFRLSLNVASTRLILSQGDAGQVIDAFGRFLVGGEVVVGIVVFLIVTIVNFVVIARGAARVSEVGARFALDALPGKQMAIEADIRSGAISSSEAQLKREELRRESQFYGAMDGSMKFVQGDAIAGVLIIVTNILGGMYLGLTQGLSFSEAGQLYTILTVGDGLVTQFPALLISICAGIVVTRVSSADNVTLSRDIISQLFGKPLTLAAAGGILVLASVMPSIPTLPFLLIGGLFLFTAYRLQRARSASGIQSGGTLALPSGLLPAHRQLTDGSRVQIPAQRIAEIQIDQRVLSRSDLDRIEDFSGWWSDLRGDFYSQTGVAVPEPSVRVASDLALGGYRIYWKGREVLSGSIPLDCVAVEVAPLHAQIYGAQIVETLSHPYDGSRICWVSATNALKGVLAEAQVSSYSPLEFVLLQLFRYQKDHPELTLGIGEVHLQLKELDRRIPGFVDEVIDKRFLTVARLAEIAQMVVRTGIGSCDIQRLLEDLATYKSAYSGSGLAAEDYDLWHIIHYLRSLRAKEVMSEILGPGGTLRVVEIDEDTQRTLSECSFAEGREIPNLTARELKMIVDPLRELINPVLERGRGIVAVLCPIEVWRQVRGVLLAAKIDLPLVSEGDLDPSLSIENIGVWHSSSMKM